MPLAGRVVTCVAVPTHRDVCQVLAEAGATFLAPVKGNQATLYAEIQDECADWPLLAGPPPLWLQADIRQASGSWEE